ncbi:hypothetical protein NQZ79_g8512 [Umbelopsis isabellina]|nr:hypothetical protein NQZ79_g8512 [Umbelopsis isabellina]
MTTSLSSRVLELEQEFFATLSPAQIKALTCNGSLETRDSHLYGEFAFLASGLKPCVLICFPDPELNRLYAERVVNKAIDHCQNFQSYSIERDIVSDEMNLGGTYMVINQDNSHASQIVKLLEDETRNNISEEQLAVFLDYPGSLPSSAEELDSMLEVASSEDPIIVTTFAAQESEVDKVKEHFQKYRSKMSEMNIDLQILIRKPGNT